MTAGENVTSFGVVSLYNKGFFPKGVADKKKLAKGNPYRRS
jgi:hypothetical protein